MKKLIAILLTLVLTGCGFKVVQNSSFNNFSISDIITEGDKRINFSLKNKLSSQSTESENKLIMGFNEWAEKNQHLWKEFVTGVPFKRDYMAKNYYCNLQ